jgi:adenylyltransferase/sulfurtransferase
MRSAKAIAFLKAQGFTKLRNLTGGILAWAQTVDPGMPTY